MVLASSTVMTPSLPTLSMASAMILPIGLVVVGGDGADLGDHLALDFSCGLLELADDRLDGLLDAALDQHRVGAGRDHRQALVEDGLGQDGGGRGAVAGHVAGLGGDFLDHLGAHVLEVVFELDFLATVTPSLVMVGEPNFLSMTTFRPLGPSVTLTASASLLTPLRMFWRASSP